MEKCPDPDCDFTLLRPSDKKCPKCGFRLEGFFYDELLVVDLAHQGENREQAKLKLIEAIKKAQQQKIRRLRIIHGYGSGGVGGVIKHYILQYIRSTHPSFRLKEDKDNLGSHILFLK